MSITWKTLSLAVAASALVAADRPGRRRGILVHLEQDGSLLDALDSGTSGVVDTLWGDDTTKQGKKASKGPGAWDASVDQGSMYNLTKSVGAQDAWARGVTGKGVTVALIDTGVVPVPGLDRTTRSSTVPTSPSRASRPARATSTATGTAPTWPGSSPARTRASTRSTRRHQFTGVAPDAKLINIKVATGDGGADVTQVIAAIDWVVEHRNDDAA